MRFWIRALFLLTLSQQSFAVDINTAFANQLRDLRDKGQLSSKDLKSYVQVLQKGTVTNPIAKRSITRSTALSLSYNLFQMHLAKVDAKKLAGLLEIVLQNSEQAEEDVDRSRKKTRALIPTEYSPLVVQNFIQCAIVGGRPLLCSGFKYIYDNFPKKIPENTVAKTIQAYDNDICVIDEHSQLLCFYSDDQDKRYTTQPQNIKVQQVSLAYGKTCAVLADSTAQCWGRDPIIPTSLGKVLSITTGNLRNCAIRMDHTASCWNWLGKPLDTPDKLGPVRKIAAYYDYACAIQLKSNNAFCWGSDFYRRFDPNSFRFENVRDIIATNDGFYVLHTNGSIEVAGNIQAPPDSIGPFVSISASRNTAGFGSKCAVRTDGSIYCWEGELRLPPDIKVKLPEHDMEHDEL